MKPKSLRQLIATAHTRHAYWEERGILDALFDPARRRWLDMAHPVKKPTCCTSCVE